jgi:1-acyl-sn-glycerol-3-phosphate acyltransferase
MKSELYPKIYLWLVAHRRWVFFFSILLAAGCLGITSRFTMEEDVLGILPQGDRIVDDYKYTLKKFRQIDRVYMDVGTTNGDTDNLGRAADEFYDRLATNDIFASITYRIEMGNQRQVIGLFTGSLPNLFTADDEKALADKLDTNSIRDYLTVMRRKLSGPEGMVLKDVVAADPIGMSALVLPKLLPLETGLGGAHVEDSRLLSSNGCHILVVAEPKTPSSDTKGNGIVIGDLLRAAHEVETNFPGTHVAITGGHRMSLDNATLIRRDSVRCIIIAVNAMFLLCFLAYRRRWLAAITFLPSLFGTIIAGAVLAMVDHELSAIAIGLASMALGITVDYGIYVVYHLDNAATDRESAGKIVARLVLPTCIGALTIISAFVVLAFSPMHGYHQLGIFGAAGVLMSAAFALFVLPLIVPLPKEKKVEQLRFTGWMENFHAWQRKRRPLLLLAVAVLTVISLFGIHKLRFEGDIAKLNGITDATRTDDKLIGDVWRDALEMTLVIAHGKTVDEALAQNDRAAALLAQQTNVLGVYSLSAVLPSAATQNENLKRWQKFWTPERKEYLRANILQISGELGFRTNAFDAFWKTIEDKPALLTLDTFRGTPMEQPFSERIAVGTNDVAVNTIVKLAYRSRVDELRAALPGLIVIDQKNFADHIAVIAKKDMGKFAVATAVVVGIIAFWTLGSTEVTIATLLPIALGLLWTLGLMGLFGLPINIMNCIFVIFVIGMGEDYSVFLATSKLDVWRGHPPRISPTSASVLISATTTIFGFAVLAFAKHPILFSMGTTVLLGMVSAFVATLVVTPACMDLLLFKRPPTGAPRWWHLLGPVQTVLHLSTIQVCVYLIQRPLQKIFRVRNGNDKLRANTAWATRGFFHALPYGRLELKNISPETFSPPCIVISNHQSSADVVVVVSLDGTVRQAAKKRVFDAPFLGYGCKILGHVMVEPGRPEVTLQRCREKLAEGASVHFYPEGTRSPDGWVQRFHRGAFELAVELNQEIQPVILCDTWTLMPRDAFWLEPFRAVAAALPRITPQNFDYSQGATPLMRHCEQIIRDALQKELDEINTPKIVRRKVGRLYRYQGRYLEQFVFWKLRLDPMFPFLDQVVPRKGFVLDLGCGHGLATHWLAQFTDTRTFLSVDYDADKIRIAQQTVHENDRIQFQFGDILEMDYPPCDAVLLLDVLHYWTLEKQQKILAKARRALRSGGKLVVREAAKAGGQAHRHTKVWEIYNTALGWNQSREGLHFRTLEELQNDLLQAGFARVEIIHGATKNSNTLLVATA